MQQAVVCRRLPPLRSAPVVEYWNTQCARRRSCLSYLRGRPDGQTELHKHLPCALSRLSSSEPGAIVPMSGCLPGLHPIHLYWFRTGMIDVPFAAVSGDALAAYSGRPAPSRFDLTLRGCVTAIGGVVPFTSSRPRRIASCKTSPLRPRGISLPPSK